MLVDTIAFLQGVINAAEKDNLMTPDECRKICILVNNVSYPGASGRSVCGYHELVGEILSMLDFPPATQARLWRYHLGPSLAFGIGTARAHREDDGSK